MELTEKQIIARIRAHGRGFVFTTTLLFPFPLTLIFYPNLNPDVIRVVSTLLKNTFCNRILHLLESP
jgi:hypothetical protein